MHVIYTGTTRVVVVFPKLGIVLKVARINWKQIGDALERTALWLSGDKKFRKIIPTFAKLIKHFKILNFRGLMANIYEWKMWKETKSAFLWPTSFSFLGLVNIQPLAKRLVKEGDLDYESWWTRVQIATEFYSWECCHAWEERNFCFDSVGAPKMLDYGSRALLEVFRRFETKLLSVDSL